MGWKIVAKFPFFAWITPYCKDFRRLYAFASPQISFLKLWSFTIFPQQAVVRLKKTHNTDLIQIYSKLGLDELLILYKLVLN